MAESIALIFKDVSWDILSKELSDIAENAGKKYWKYPSADDDYTLILYEYDSWLCECEPKEVYEITQRLGAEPSVTLCIELRRTKQKHACNHAEAVVVALLKKHNGLVDDTIENLWSLSQIEKGGFLREYKRGL